MGRWRSGAPLALSPDYRDDPQLGADRKRNNDLTAMTTSSASRHRRALTFVG